MCMINPAQQAGRRGPHAMGLSPPGPPHRPEGGAPHASHVCARSQASQGLRKGLRTRRRLRQQQEEADPIRPEDRQTPRMPIRIRHVDYCHYDLRCYVHTPRGLMRPQPHASRGNLQDRQHRSPRGTVCNRPSQDDSPPGSLSARMQQPPAGRTVTPERLRVGPCHPRSVSGAVADEAPSVWRPLRLPRTECTARVDGRGPPGGGGAAQGATE